MSFYQIAQDLHFLIRNNFVFRRLAHTIPDAETVSFGTDADTNVKIYGLKCGGLTFDLDTMNTEDDDQFILSVMIDRKSVGNSKICSGESHLGNTIRKILRLTPDELVQYLKA